MGYLNAKTPLLWALRSSHPRSVCRWTSPVGCPSCLAAGELEVRPIPSVEYLRAATRGYLEIIPGFVIAAHGPVRSVKLFSRRAVAPGRAAGARCRVADKPCAGANLARHTPRGTS